MKKEIILGAMLIGGIASGTFQLGEIHELKTEEDQLNKKLNSQNQWMVVLQTKTAEDEGQINNILNSRPLRQAALEDCIKQRAELYPQEYNHVEGCTND